MTNPVPERPKIYHIVHVDRLSSIVESGCLWCDAEVERRSPDGTTIGMQGIKHRRLHTLRLASYPDLHVGECVPFNFCPRSVMLYLLHKRNPELEYRGGQEHIIHLQADMHDTVEWAGQQGYRWAFTLSNAGANYFEDRSDLDNLDEINWPAVRARDWGYRGVPSSIKEGKQAEFLVEQEFSWSLVSQIGVHSRRIHDQVCEILDNTAHKPKVAVRKNWYY